MNSQIDKLLKLQNCDLAYNKIKARLKDIPLEIAVIKDKIAAEKKPYEDAQKSQKDMEAKRLAMRTERLALDEKIVKYKTQLLNVKKNEEYQAMLSQIEGCKAEISAIEEKEIELLYQIDEQVKTVAQKLQDFEKAKALYEAQIDLKNNENSMMSSSLEAAKNDVDKASQNIDENYLETYKRLKTTGKRMPVLVAIQNEKCDGCHLSLSKVLVSEAETATKPVYCEQCGRMVYKA